MPAHPYYYKIVLGVGKDECGAKNLPGLVPRNPGSPESRTLVKGWGVGAA